MKTSFSGSTEKRSRASNGSEFRAAFITGITGQDGSFLAEILLDKGYSVYGMIRRASNFNTKRIDHIFDKLHIFYGDMTDIASIIHILEKIKLESYDVIEIYNLAAQSHVKVSFENPIYTANVDAIGALNIFEAVRITNLISKTRIYQASSSEMYGHISAITGNVAQNEETPFYPRSPYGVAKLFAYWIGKNYRESYGMYICNGILQNHETLAGFMPLIFKNGKNGEIDIKPISEIVTYYTTDDKPFVDENIKCYQEGLVQKELYVWDNNDWTRVKYASAYPHDIDNDNKNPRFIVSKNASYLTTSDHVIIMDDDTEKKTKDIVIGDKIKLINFPIPEVNHEYEDQTTDTLENDKLSFFYRETTEDDAELLGLLVGDGYIRKNSNNIAGAARFTNKDIELIEYVKKLWEKICIFYNVNIDHNFYLYNGKSGFTGGLIYQLSLLGFNDFFRKYELYNKDKTKRVPKQILNSNKQVQLKFLQGYNLADGLKSGHGIYEFRNFKTNSATLAQGLIYLIKNTTKQDFNINIEYVYKFNQYRTYYSINLLSNSKYSLTNSEEKKEIVLSLIDSISQREIQRQTGISRDFIRKIQNDKQIGVHNKLIKNNVVKKIIELPNYDGWFYDLETESGTFHAGIGLGRIHNSPRRAKTFVTRKITIGISRILKNKTECLVLGNLDAKRDWGYAKEYCEGMYLMLQHPQPDDYVLATGETHSVREFVEKAFQVVGIEIEWQGKGFEEVGIDKNSRRVLVRIDEKYFRPSEVEFLLGDATKAKTILGWKPQVTFDKLVELMVKADLDV